MMDLVKLRADSRLGMTLHEPHRRKGGITPIKIDADPSPAQSLGDVTGCVGTREDVDDQIPWLGEEPNEEVRQLGRESRRMTVLT